MDKTTDPCRAIAEWAFALSHTELSRALCLLSGAILLDTTAEAARDQARSILRRAGCPVDAIAYEKIAQVQP